MKFKKLILTVITLSVLIFGLNIAAAGQEESEEQTQPRRMAHLYGLQSLSFGQTATLSVVNTVFPGQRGNRETSESSRRVLLVIDVYTESGRDPEAGGRNFTFERRISRIVSLAPGEAATFDFSADQGNVFFDASVFMGVEPEPFAPAAIVSALNIEENGRKVLAVPPSIKFFNPPSQGN